MIHLLLISINIIYLTATMPYAKEPYQMMMGVYGMVIMNGLIMLGYFWLIHLRFMP